MRVFLFLLGICGFLALTTANKKCKRLAKKFEDCLARGFKPKKLEGCKSGDGKLEKEDAKKCAKYEKSAIKNCDYSCKSDDKEDEEEDKMDDFVPETGAKYQLKKVGGPGDGDIMVSVSSDRRNYQSYWPHLRASGVSPVPFTITKASCDCDDCDNCLCYKLTFRAKINCCQYATFALAVHGDTRKDTGNGIAILHKSPWNADDECWAIEPAKGGYKLRKAHGRQKGKYLVAGIPRSRSGNGFWVEVTDDPAAATVWDIGKL